MNLIFRKNALQARIIVVVGCLLLTRPAIALGNDIRDGRKLYLQHCAACHGAKGEVVGSHASREGTHSYLKFSTDNK